MLVLPFLSGTQQTRSTFHTTALTASWFFFFTDLSKAQRSVTALKTTRQQHKKMKDIPADAAAKLYVLLAPHQLIKLWKKCPFSELLQLCCNFIQKIDKKKWYPTHHHVISHKTRQLLYNELKMRKRCNLNSTCLWTHWTHAKKN